MRDKGVDGYSMKHPSHSVINGLNSNSPGQPLIAHLDRMRAEALTLNASGLKCQQLFNKKNYATFKFTTLC
jgi:hypothetical protein